MYKYILFVMLFSFSSFAIGPTIDCSGPFAQPAPEEYELVRGWCNQNSINHFWNTYKLYKGDWSKWGYKNVCDPTYGLARVINGLYKMELVSNKNKYFGDGMRLWIKNKARIFDWADFTVNHDKQGFKPRCATTNGLLGENKTILFPIDLTQNTIHYRNVDVISAVIIHELTHNDVSHISDSSCMNKASCDTLPGDYNATTTELYYLIDSMTAFRRSPTGNLMMSFSKINVNGPKYNCSYVPLTSARERALDGSFIIYKLFNNYQNFINTYISSSFIRDSIITPYQNLFANAFTCDVCSISSYDFKPATKYLYSLEPLNLYNSQNIGQYACNEALSKANIQINNNKRNTCSYVQNSLDSYINANSPIDTSFLSQLYMTVYNANNWKCADDNPSDIHNYCNETINAQPNDIYNIDKYGIYSASNSKYWPAISDSLLSCCKQVSYLNQPSKMGILGCEKAENNYCNFYSFGNVDLFNACKTCVYSENKLKCFYDNGKQMPLTCYQFNECMDLVNDSDYCKKLEANCL